MQSFALSLKPKNTSWAINEYMKYILLENWARLYGVKPMDAKNYARRGKLKTARKLKVEITRWVIDKNEKPLEKS